MKLIVGLGNPGKEYDGTRHNVGREIVRALAEEWTLDWKTEKKLYAEVAVYATTKGTFVSTKVPFVVRLALPTTFMNDSGRAVQSLITSYQLLITDVLVVHDDLDLPLGTLRFSQRSGAAGQKGVQSIIDALNTKDFARLRIGVAGAHRETTDAAAYVLKKFSREEQSTVNRIKKQAQEAIADYCTKGLTKAMNHWNKKGA